MTAVYLFLFAHPDDDAFIAGTMRSLVTARAEVHAAWLTSGDYFGQGAAREKELANAVSALGLDSSHVHLLRFPDLGLVRMLDRAADKVAELMASTRPSKVYATAYEGGHPDHDCVNFLAYESADRAGLKPQRYEFPLYNGAGEPRHWRWRINTFPAGGPEVLRNKLDDDAIRFRQKVTWIYSSQWLYMIPARVASSHSRLSRVGEPYRICPPDRDHTMRPHEGRLNYERWFCSFMKISFEDYRTAVLNARQSFKE